MGIKKLLGLKIKKIRISKGLTQEELSEKIEITQRALSGIENGLHFVKAETLDKLANALEISVEDLFQVEHLKDSKLLIAELTTQIEALETNPEKLQEIYKIIKTILKE
ncbi:MAG: helix-turn-helix transcriptional regulator [Candidatus Gastranaerophilales bacterium]